MSLFNHILGSLAGSAIGDAMGTATKLLSGDEIIRRFGAPIAGFVKPPADNPVVGGIDAGQITDDFSQTYYIAKKFVEVNGKIMPQHIVDALIDWSRNPSYFPRFAGTLLKRNLKHWLAGEDPVAVGKSVERETESVSNGAAKRVSPAGLAHPGDIDGAIDDSVVICQPTHGSQIGMSGCAAVAAAVAEALSVDSTVASVVKAAEIAAIKGEEIGRVKGRIAAGPSIVHRIEFAVQTVMTTADPERACRKLGDYIGAGPNMADAVPVAIGVFFAMNGEPFAAIKQAINLGGDSNTIGCITGAISGAYAGFDAIPRTLYDQVVEKNHLDLEGLAKGFEKLNLSHNERVFL